MSKTQRLRESARELSLDLLAERAREGWRLSALEWEREVEDTGLTDDPATPTAESTSRAIEPPYGLRIAAGHQALEHEPDEQRVILTIFGLIVQDVGCGEIARTLNERGFRTRSREPWTPRDVFQLMPRLIEAGQETFASERWAEIRRGLFRAS